MKIKKLEDKTIIEVSSKEAERLLQYPDLFEKIEEVKEVKDSKPKEDKSKEK